MINEEERKTLLRALAEIDSLNVQLHQTFGRSDMAEIYETLLYRIVQTQTTTLKLLIKVLTNEH